MLILKCIIWVFFVFFINIIVCSSDMTDFERVKLEEGRVLSLHPRDDAFNKDNQILWTFLNGSQSSRIAQMHNGKIYTHYDKRFTDRLQLDQQTGALNISNINTDDSGVYEALIINKQITKKKYKVDVYAPVPLVITSSLVSVHQFPACLSLCLQVLLYCEI
nr:CD48 antigen-like [Misgurnus anguillicaudatus]